MSKLLNASGEPIVPEYVVGFPLPFKPKPPAWLVLAASMAGCRAPQLVIRLQNNPSGAVHIAPHEEKTYGPDEIWHYTVKISVPQGQPLPRPDIGWECDGEFMYLVENPEALRNTFLAQATRGHLPARDAAPPVQ